MSTCAFTVCVSVKTGVKITVNFYVKIDVNFAVKAVNFYTVNFYSVNFYTVNFYSVNFRAVNFYSVNFRAVIFYDFSAFWGWKCDTDGLPDGAWYEGGHIHVDMTEPKAD